MITIFLGLTFFAYASNSNSSYSFNYDLLNKIDNEVREGEYGKITGLVVLNDHGRVLHERYYGFTSRSTINQISSVTKSITSLLVGVCLEKGFISSIDTPIWKYFPEYSDIFKKDTLKAKITIRHLLNQTAGLKWNEWMYPYNYASNSLMALLKTESNWVERFFKLQNDTLPGTKFCYNSISSQIIAEILSRSSGLSFEELTKQYLFDPLYIKDYLWDRYPSNNLPAWGGISLSTRDMAKLGLIILNNGKVGSKQIVSQDWVTASTQEYISFSNDVGYGLHWWIGKQPNGNPLIYAAGYGDQYVYIVPDKEIVIAINAQNFSDYRWPKDVDSLVNSILESMVF
ncbi:MAG: serine hydrolase domain-containing protein [Bacteroidales bacterium]